MVESDAHELEIADDIEASGYFSLNVLNNGVSARVCDNFISSDIVLPPKSNLFAISNTYGWAVAATADGFSLINLAELRSLYVSAKQRTTPNVAVTRNVKLGLGGLSFLRIGTADKSVIAAGPALQGRIEIWSLKNLVDGSDTTPYHTFQAANSPLLDILPNPSDRPELVALLHQDGQLTMLDLNAKTTIATFGVDCTAACWSVKGKQIVCGDNKGGLTQYTPEGEAKTVTEPPPSLQGRAMAVIDIRWVENTVFFVTYLDTTNSFDTQIYVTTRHKNSQVEYAPLLDPLMIETTDRSEARFNTWLKNWTPFKHLLLICNSTSNTISHVGQATSEDGTEVWSQVSNDLYATLPLETFPLGLEIDLTATEQPQVEENIGETPTPILWAYSSDGTLSAWRVLNARGGQYHGISAAKDIRTQKEDAIVSAPSAEKETSPMPATPPPTSNTSFSKSSFGGSTFGAGAFQSPSAFGVSGGTTFGKAPTFAPAFGQSTFGAHAATPTFGQSTFTKSAFSSPTTTAGSSTPFGAPPASSSSNTPASGGFANLSASSMPSAFATSANNASSISPFPTADSAHTSPSFFTSGNAVLSGTGSVGAFGSKSGANFGFASAGKANSASSDPDVASPAGLSNPFGPSQEKTPSVSPFAMSSAPVSMQEQPRAPAFGFSNTSKSTPFSGFGSSKLQSGGFGGFNAGANTNASGSGFDGFPGSEGGTTFGFGKFSKPASEATSSAFGPSQFGELRSTTTNSSQQLPAPPKPLGLNEDETDALEPDVVSNQKGGALDFGGSSPASSNSSNHDADGLSMKGFGFGGGQVRSEADGIPDVPFKLSNTSGKKETPSFAQVNVGASKNTSFASPSTFVEQSLATPISSSSGPGESDQSPVNQNKQAEHDEPLFAFAAKQGDLPKPSSFSASGFGQFSSFGTTSKANAFSLVKPHEAVKASPAEDKEGFSNSKGTPPIESAFGKPAPLGSTGSAFPSSKSNEAKTTPIKSAFSAFASPSTSPSTSPFAPSSKPFGQPGFFGGFGQTTKVEGKSSLSQDSKTNQVKDEVAKPAERGGLAEGNIEEEEEESETGEQEQDGTDDDDEEENEDEEAETRSDGYEDQASEEAKSDLSESEENSDESDSGVHEENTTSQNITLSSINKSTVTEEPESPSPLAAPPKSRREVINDADISEQHPSDRSAPTKTSETTDAPVTGSPAANHLPTRPVEARQPFGFTALQKAAPRTSSPLASMPSFPPDTSSVVSQTSPSTEAFSRTPQNSKTAGESQSSPRSSLSTPHQPTPSTVGESRTVPSRPLALDESSNRALVKSNSHPPKLGSSHTVQKTLSQDGRDAIGIFASLQDQLDALKDSIAQCQEFYQSVHLKKLPIQKGDLDHDILKYETDAWSLGDLPKLGSLSATLAKGLTDVTRKAEQLANDAKIVEGSSLKTKAKTEEINRYLKARNDPAIAKLVKVRQLGPEQLENQYKIRHSQESVREAIDELEHVISTLKDKVIERKLGRTPLKAPSLDSIHRAMRNITNALRIKALELDDLALRLDMANLTTDTLAGGKKSSHNEVERELSISRQGGRQQGSSPTGAKVQMMTSHRSQLRELTPDVEKKVQRMLAAEVFGQRLKEVWLANGRTQPLINKSAHTT